MDSSHDTDPGEMSESNERTSLPGGPPQCTDNDKGRILDKKTLAFLSLTIVLLISNLLVALAYLDEIRDDDDPHDQENGNNVTREQFIGNVTVYQTYSMIQNNTGNAPLVILDVRVPLDFRNGHIPGAINLDYFNDSFEFYLSIFDKNIAYIVYCDGGGVSDPSVDIMEEMGFLEVYHLVTGFERWKELGYDVEGGDS